MQVRATNMTAAVTGLYSGLLGLVLGPRVDAGAGGPWWLLIATAAFGGPAYFFVFGVRRDEMVGLWVLKPALLERMALCFAGIICVATIAQVVSSLWGKGAT